MAGKKKFSSWIGDDGADDGSDVDDGGSEWVDEQTVTITGPQEEAPQDYTTVEDIPLRRHWLHRLFVPQDDTTIVDQTTVDQGYRGYRGGYQGGYPGRGYQPSSPRQPNSPFRPSVPGRPSAPRPGTPRVPVGLRPNPGSHPGAPRLTAHVTPHGPPPSSRTTIQGEFFDEPEVD